MSALSKFLSRILWSRMLWLMRRPWMKSLQRNSLKLVPVSMRDRVRIAHNRQNRFARRHALVLLNFTITLFMASVLLTTGYLVVITMAEHGIFSRPKSFDQN